MRLAIFSLLTTLALAATAVAETPTTIPASAIATAVQLREQALKDPTAYAVVESLTTEIGPRLAGGPNDLRAREWAIAKFKKLGFDKVYTEPVKFPKWVRRSEHAEILAPFPQPLTVTALGGSVGTAKGGLRGDVVAFKTLDDLKRADAAQVKGKIVYVGYHMQTSQGGADYGHAVGARVAGASIAAKLGASAIVIRSSGTDNERMPHTGVLHYADDAPKIPAAALSNSDADLVERMLTRGQPVALKLALDCGTEGEYQGANVIGEITGSERPEQAILIGGHLDSWDLGTGAIDDGAGVGISMAAAHLIGRLPQRPKRTIRVIAFANEEAGLFGGKAYAEAHQHEVQNLVLGSESDLGADRIYRLDASVKPAALGAIDQMMQVLGPLGVARGDRPGTGGSDMSAVHGIGMAALSLQQDATRYFDWHHTANDTLDKIDPEQLAQNVAVYAVFAYLAAQADGDFGSAPGAFAGARDQ